MLSFSWYFSVLLPKDSVPVMLAPPLPPPPPMLWAIIPDEAFPEVMTGAEDVTVTFDAGPASPAAPPMLIAELNVADSWLLYDIVAATLRPPLPPPPPMLWAKMPGELSFML
jgi:hypothetical protein